MKKTNFNTSTDILSVLFCIIIISYFIINTLLKANFNISQLDLTEIQTFNTIFLSIIMQAFPFLLIGVLISSAIHVFVSRNFIENHFHKNKFLSFIMSIFGGLLFPVCDCAIVPVATRLVRKGLPLYIAIAFMLSAPIINPLVIASTLYAFPENPMIAVYRISMGVIIAIFSSVIFYFLSKNKTELLDEIEENHACCCSHCCSDEPKTANNILTKISAIFKHAGEEFFEVGKFLIMGSFLTAMFQATVPQDLFDAVGSSEVISLVIMMGAAFILSVCSSSDAFIARSFANQFSTGSLMGFLVLGPLLDLKNMFMLLANFNKKFVITFMFVVSVISFIVTYSSILILF